MEIVVTLIIGAAAGWLGSMIYKGSGLGIIGNKLHYLHIPQSIASFVLKIFEVRWSKPCYFLKLV
jgi:uncharacterized membrane protein YeaQ/YmgE (transglycosylase-associated protein family)